MCCQALLKRAQELTPTSQDQSAVLSLVTKIQSVLDNLVVAPSLFEAAVSTFKMVSWLTVMHGFRFYSDHFTSVLL